MALRAFVRLSRLKFLAGGLMAGALGTAIAASVHRHFDAGAYALAQSTITSFHLMTHYANDYYDRRSDATAVRTPYSGGSGTLVDGTLDPAVALRAAAACAGLGMAGSLALAATGAVGSALAALAVFVGAWTYSAPPLRLCARGLGELDTAFVVAVLVPLCAFLAQGAELEDRFWGSVLPPAAAMVAMMLAVEFPDAVADARADKRTLVVRAGPRIAQLLGVACVLATVTAFGAALYLGAPQPYALAAAGSIAAGLPLARAFVVWKDADHACSLRLARLGVGFFFIVTSLGVAAYGWTLWPGAGATLPHTGTVTGT